MFFVAILAADVANRVPMKLNQGKTRCMISDPNTKFSLFGILWEKNTQKVLLFLFKNKLQDVGEQIWEKYDNPMWENCTVDVQSEAFLWFGAHSAP